MKDMNAFDKLDDLPSERLTVPGMLGKRVTQYSANGDAVSIDAWIKGDKERISNKISWFKDSDNRCWLEQDDSHPIMDDAVVDKNQLMDYLMDLSGEPCVCGSGRRYDKCHYTEDVQKITDAVVQLN